MASRVHVQGDLFHGRVPDGAVYIGRGAPGLPASRWRNPYSVKEHGRDRALHLYRAMFDRELVDRARHDIEGRDVACWCKASDEFHGDVLLALIGGTP